MSEFMFGCGNGKVSNREYSRVNKIAKKHGASFVRYCGPECYCGYGCGGCNHRYWFAGPNMGHPFDTDLASSVMAEVGTIKTK